jgi:hypothetical protein
MHGDLAIAGAQPLGAEIHAALLWRKHVGTSGAIFLPLATSVYIGASITFGAE